MSYNTKQKELIKNILISKRKEFTIKEIYDELHGKVGLTTVYRLVDSLLKDGVIKKSISKDNITLYSYLSNCEEKNHFYLKCENCKELIHVDCDCINELATHIKKHHKFNLNKNNIVINGLCDKCRKEDRKC